MEVNEKLKEKIFSSIPKDYSPLEKAIHVYYELCRTLHYSMGYYLEEKTFESYFTNPNNLVKVDGETNKDVVCFTFNAIYILLLKELEEREHLGIKCEDISSCLKRDGNFSTVHESVTFAVNSQAYEADSTYGVLDKNDLVLLKYTNSMIEGITAISPNPKITDMELQKTLQKVCRNEKNINYSVSVYSINTEQEGLSLDERVKLFLNLGIKNPFGYSVPGLNYMLKIKHSLFSKEELEGHRSVSGKYSGIDIKIEMTFAKNTKTNEYEVYLLYNPKGYTRDKGYENFDSLEVYKISLKNCKATKIDLDKFKDDILNETLINRKGGKTRPNILEEGIIFTRETYVGGEAIYNDKQKPINIESIVRILIKDNEKEIKIK